MDKIVSILKKIIRPIYSGSKRCFEYNIMVMYYRYFQAKALRKIKKKESFRCVFLALFDSVWKCDSLYREMLKDVRFAPIIVICPVVNYGHDNMIQRMRDCRSFFDKKGYNYIVSYNENTGEYLDIKKELKPDIVFYTNPYRGLIDNKYYIDNFKDVLTCYIPYFYASGNNPAFYDLPFHHYVWKYFCENESLKKEFEQTERKKLANIVPVGFCPFDEFEEKKVTRDSRIKKVIWAPHHMLEASGGVVVRNSFLRYYDSFFKLADKFQGKVEFVFRPHPLLKNKLYAHPDWGKARTDSYYSKWKAHNYCSLDEHTNYIELFYNTDAMIHDCGSFTTEYLYVNKPALFSDRSFFGPNEYWKSAIDAVDCYYRADSEAEIETFITDVVLNGNDYLFNKRLAYKEKYLCTHELVGRKIINTITNIVKEENECV